MQEDFEVVNLPEELIQSIHENTLDRIHERSEENINQLSSASSKISLTDTELCEMGGALYIDEQEGQTKEQQIELLENVEKPH